MYSYLAIYPSIYLSIDLSIYMYTDIVHVTIYVHDVYIYIYLSIYIYICQENAELVADSLKPFLTERIIHWRMEDLEVGT